MPVNSELFLTHRNCNCIDFRQGLLYLRVGLWKLPRRYLLSLSVLKSSGAHLSLPWARSSTCFPTWCPAPGHTRPHTRPAVHSLAWWPGRFGRRSACDTERPPGSAPHHPWHSSHTWERGPEEVSSHHLKASMLLRRPLPHCSSGNALLIFKPPSKQHMNSHL